VFASARETAQKPAKAPISQKSTANEFDLLKIGVFGGLLRRLPRACKHSANHLKCVRLKYGGPGTAAK